MILFLNNLENSDFDFESFSNRHLILISNLPKDDFIQLWWYQV